MNYRKIWILLMMVCVWIGCANDEVDSDYLFDIEDMQAVVTKLDGRPVMMDAVLLDSLQKQGFVGEVTFSEESRADNDRLAEERFIEKCENIKNIRPAALLHLQPGEQIKAAFDYVLKRGKEELKREKIELQETIPNGE